MKKNSRKDEKKCLLINFDDDSEENSEEDEKELAKNLKVIKTRDFELLDLNEL